MYLHPDPQAWAATEAELSLINVEFCQIHETPSKDLTPQQHARLAQLRAQARQCGDRRQQLLSLAWAKRQAKAVTN